MLILKVTNPEGKVRYISAAFPSACGKTNFAMMEPTIDGWKAEMVGDDIAWIEFDENHQARVVNPEAGLFGVAPGTGYSHQPERYEGYQGQHHLHQRCTDRRRLRLVEADRRTPEHLIDWTGQDWTPSLAARQLTRTLASAPRIPGRHARSRVLRPRGACR